MDTYSRKKNTPELVKALGEKIVEAVILGDEKLVLKLENGGKLSIMDMGQSCCEHRYLTCDDDLASFAGATLFDVGFASGPTEEDDHGEPHETGFVKVDTSLGGITLTTHNEHNGYYGGFDMRIKYEEG